MTIKNVGIWVALILGALLSSTVILFTCIGLACGVYKPAEMANSTVMPGILLGICLSVMHSRWKDRKEK